MAVIWTRDWGQGSIQDINILLESGCDLMIFANVFIQDLKPHLFLGSQFQGILN